MHCHQATHSMIVGVIIDSNKDSDKMIRVFNY